MRILSQALLLTACAVLMSACAGRQELVGGDRVTVIPGDQLPAPDGNATELAQRPYRIGPFDKLEIDVFGVEELKREVQADSGGRISFPLVGSVEAGGRTSGELAADLTTRLRTYVKNPQVTVNLKEAVSSNVTIEGAVREPGNYPVVGRTTLIRTIAAAKGMTEVADVQHAVIFRTIDGRQLAALYSVRAIREGRYDDPEVFANDVIVIGESGARRFFRDLTAASPLLTAPIIALLN